MKPCSVLLAVSFLALLVSARETSAQTTCHLITTSNASQVPSGYGMPFDVLTSTREMLIRTGCTSSGASIGVGVGNTHHYVYTKGYQWRNNAWQQYTLSGSNQVSTDWLIGSANATLSRNTSEMADPNWFVAYICHLQSNTQSWKCGCRDAACSTPYWQLQAFQGTASGPVGGEEGGDTTTGGMVGGNHASAPPGLKNATSRGSGIAKAGANGVIDLSTSECFNKPVSSIFKYPEGRYKRPFVVKGSVGNTYDLRGAMFEANPLQFPVLFNDPHDTCVVGPTIAGQQPRSMTWFAVKHADNVKLDGDGIGWENSTGKFIIEGAWIDNMEDGVGMPFDLVPDRSTTWSIRHAYFKYIRDDVIENDGCLSGDIQDTFMDGVWTFLSSNPSTPARPLINDSATITVKDTIIRMECMPDPRDGKGCNSKRGMGIGMLFKGGSSCKIKMNMENVVILQEENRGAPSWPSGTYKNVTLIWEVGSFPKVPSGVTVTRGRDKYNQARASWIQRHGCDNNVRNCTYLNHSGINKTPPANSKPYVVLGTSPSFMPLERAGTVQWWTENVSNCSPSGRGLELVGGASGQRRLGSRWVKNWTDKEETVMYSISCKAPNGSTIEDSGRLVWSNRSNDSQNPSIPTNVKATASRGAIKVTWSESSDNFEIASYRVYRNNAWIANVSSKPVFVDTGVTAGTNYSYQIQAMDAFGNLSGKSSAVSVQAQ